MSKKEPVEGKKSIRQKQEEKAEVVTVFWASNRIWKEPICRKEKERMKRRWGRWGLHEHIAVSRVPTSTRDYKEKWPAPKSS